jgi:hypothetical protein
MRMVTLFLALSSVRKGKSQLLQEPAKRAAVFDNAAKKSPKNQQTAD